MGKYQCFKIKRGTKYDEAVKHHFSLEPKWKLVFKHVSDLLGEEINKLGFSKDQLIVDPYELTKEENKKLFKKDGSLKGNLKKSKELLKEYKSLIEEVGLSEYEELRFINFAYGVMRTHGQTMEQFKTSEDDIYYKCNFDLEKKTSGAVEPISEIAYEEKYLEELKKREGDDK